MPEAPRRYKPKHYKTSDQLRGNSAQRGYDGRWRKFRRWFLTEHPLCEDCLEQGIVSPATEVHHLKKVAEFPELKLEPSNCRALDKWCHSKRTKRGE